MRSQDRVVPKGRLDGVTADKIKPEDTEFYKGVKMFLL